MAELSYAPQARRAFLGLAAAAGLTLTLGACQIIPDANAPETIARPEPEPVRPDPEPVVRPAPGTDARHRVAVLVPLTGANGGVGQSIANAANLALTDTGGDRVRITVYDTAKGAAAAANQALAEGNRLFLGPLLADDVRAIAPLARARDVPVISFSNDVSVAGDGVYLMGFVPTQSIERVVGHARAEGAERFAGLIAEGDYGRRSGQALLGAVERSGGRIVGVQNYDRAPQGLRSAVTRLNGQTGYDAVLIADNGRIAPAAAALIRAGSSREARILGTELWKTETNLGASTAVRGAWFASVSDTMFNQLRSRYRARYGRAPYRLASLGYDAVLLTVRIAGDWRVGRPFPARELANEEGFTGVDGAFRFGRDGVAERALEVQEVTAGGFTIVSPAPRGFR